MIIHRKIEFIIHNDFEYQRTIAAGDTPCWRTKQWGSSRLKVEKITGKEAEDLEQEYQALQGVIGEPWQQKEKEDGKE